MLGVGLAGADRAAARTPLLQCEDGIDNDGDGAIDFPFEPGCSSLLTDNTELNPTTLAACSNGVDDDGSQGEFPTDPGCASASDNNENNPTTLPQCGNTIDDDGDGQRDFVMFGMIPIDIGCAWAADSEPNSQCSDHIDNDADGRADWPADPGCGLVPGTPAATSPSVTVIGVNDDGEADLPVCNDGRDNDGDGNVDAEADPGCGGLLTGASEGTVVGPPAACADGVDNDGDGAVDLADAGCSSALDDDEANTVVQYVLPQGELTPGAGAGAGSKSTRLLSPFPIVRLRGRVDAKGVRVTLLTVRAPAGATVAVYCSGRSCPVRRLAVKATTKLVRMRRFETRLSGGTILKVYVTKAGFLGKYTRFRFTKNRVPLRTDRCATVAGTKPQLCPAS